MKKLRWLSVAASLLVLFAALGVFAQQGEPPIVPPGQLRAAIATQEQYTPGIMLISNVVGTAVSAGPGGRGVIVVYVSSADVSGIPAALDGFPVILQVTGEIVALQGQSAGKGGGGKKSKDPPVDRTARFDRPVPIGISTGHPAITAGTIARVIDGDGTVYALSNNHVYANQNNASIGNPVIQPGAFDGGSSPGDDIGVLDAFVTIDFSGGDNIIDAAIAEILSPGGVLAVGNATPSDGYGTPRSAWVEASVNLSVIKYGRTTGQTKGRVQAINATVNVGYSAGTALFIRQIIIGGGRFSGAGDSGALIVVQKGSDALAPVGLLFAGSPSFTVANPIADVLTLLKVTIDGS